MELALDIPPGVFRNGTQLQAAGRWWDASLVRWDGRQLAPVGGWRQRSAAPVSGAARAILPWKTNASPPIRWIAVGTHTRLYVQDVAGVNFDITPSGFVAGAADETLNTGFGMGSFGAGAFGTPRPDTGSTTDALVWDLDAFGALLVACAFSDGRLVEWDGNSGHPAAAIAGAPTGCLGLAVSEQGFLFAFAPGGVGRRVQWSDQGVETTWTPSSTNQAGQVDLVTLGTIKKGVRLGSLILVLTDVDAHVGRYVGLPFVFEFQRVGSGCGALSKGCVAAMGQQAVWWSRSGFWLFDGGSVQPVECEVFDWLKSNLNKGQRSKVTSLHNSEFGEVWWFYPSASSTENDSYVSWDYRRNHWSIGALGRLAGAQHGVFRYPLALDAAGYVHEHEVGFDHGGAVPFAETGPVQLGEGDVVMSCRAVVPDEASAGAVTLDFLGRDHPGAPERILQSAVFDGSGIAWQRWSARQARMRVNGAMLADWRFGTARLDLRPGGAR